jgi:hypothetical protein
MTAILASDLAQSAIGRANACRFSWGDPGRLGREIDTARTYNQWYRRPSKEVEA